MSDITPNVVVSMPSQLFTLARSFKAASNGKIYIGLIDTDPTIPSNQIQVYLENEDGEHVPVSQPISINMAGYPVYGGQIAKFVTVQGHSMAVYDAYGTQQFYFPNLLKYDPDQLKVLLAGPDGSTYIGDGTGTVSDSLRSLEHEFDLIQSLDGRPNPPLTEDYSGYKRWNPIREDGVQLGQYVFKTPTHVDFQFVCDPINSATGPVFSMGRDDLTNRAAFFSQDSYEIRNVMLDGGTGKLVEFEPWTALMSTVSNCRVINPSTGGEWVINFKAQNWWPHVIGNTYMEYNDVKGNFVKAIDDGSDESLRYTANSRLLIKDNRCAWAGLEIGGVMSYTSAVGVSIKDNASQNSKTAVVFGYPSTFSLVDGLYCEMAFGEQQAVQIGDGTASDGHSVLSEISIHDVYANYHSLNTNRLVVPGNSTIVMNGIEVDRIFITNVPSTGFIQPLVSVNDLPFQKVIAGRATAKDTPLLPLTSNHVAVIDKYGCNIPALNGDLVFAENPSTAIPANSSTAVAPGWFARSTSATTFTRSGSGSPQQALRMSRYIASIVSGSGATTSITYEHPRADLINGEVVTIQALFNATAGLTFSVNIYVANDNGSRTTLLSKTLAGGGAWKELTYTVAVAGVETASSFVVVEIGATTPSSTTIFVTGHRMNRGEYGLCTRANSFSYAETQRMKLDYSYITP
ncbi:phage head-binding domain-containing protein [Enterobacter ludwigii]|uniref:phage head-binding domain-containing protein n=1 Tax=Enterobacter ludwigii TaxID=299767 RepID=UPI003F71D41C